MATAVLRPLCTATSALQPACGTVRGASMHPNTIRAQQWYDVWHARPHALPCWRHQPDGNESNIIWQQASGHKLWRAGPLQMLQHFVDPKLQSKSQRCHHCMSENWHICIYCTTRLLFTTEHWRSIKSSTNREALHSRVSKHIPLSACCHHLQGRLRAPPS